MRFILKINIQLNTAAAAAAATRKYIIKSIKQTAFLRCFLTPERVLADKTLNRENDSSGITFDSCPGCVRPYNADPIAKINIVRDLALIFY